MKLFELRREVDETGISGTGTVAQGVVFDNGWCALTWLTDHTSVAFYTSVEEVVTIHGHNGQTRVVQIVDGDRDSWAPLVTNAVQDDFEGVVGDYLKSPHDYMWGQRDKFVTLFDEVALDE